MSAHRLSLAQQIAQLSETAPIDVDPEDELQGPHGYDENDHDHDDEDKTLNNAAAREHYLEVGPSAIRKLHDSVADPKYGGVRTSRKQLEDESEDEDEDEEMSGEDDDFEAAEEDSIHPPPDDEDASIASESSSESSHEPITPPKSSPNRPSPSPADKTTSDLPSTLLKSRTEDRKKGQAVSRQLALWDTLLDARIRLQKAVTSANRLPLPDDLPTYTASSPAQESVNKMLDEALVLSDDLFDLREDLMKTNDSIEPPPRKRRRTEQETDYVAEVRSASEAASVLEHVYHPHLIKTFQKWSNKVQSVSSSVLLSKPSFSNKSSNQVKSAVQLVDETLSDYDKLLARTRVSRGSKGRLRVGSTTETNDEEEDKETFDDTDFYQQLLRDVISSQTDNNTSGAGTTFAYPNQNKTTKKTRAKAKAIDTKASKGRKLRFEVHEKLQNFMVPVPVVGKGVWHEEQIDELFASLLGRGYGGEGQVEKSIEVGGEDKRLEVEAEKGLAGGFRVFG